MNLSRDWVVCAEESAWALGPLTVATPGVTAEGRCAALAAVIRRLRRSLELHCLDPRDPEARLILFATAVANATQHDPARLLDSVAPVPAFTALVLWVTSDLDPNKVPAHARWDVYHEFRELVRCLDAGFAAHDPAKRAWVCGVAREHLERARRDLAIESSPF